MHLLQKFNKLLLTAMIAGGIFIATAQAAKFVPLVVHTSKEAQMFQVEIANTPKALELGLMNRTELAANEGMLFVFPLVRPVSFWMRNTLIPLDMIFIDEKGVVTSIHSMAKPLDETPIPSTGPVKAVLEIAGGQALQRGIKPGDTIETDLLQGTHQ
jgi:uncharacterized protein